MLTQIGLTGAATESPDDVDEMLALMQRPRLLPLEEARLECLLSRNGVTDAS